MLDGGQFCSSFAFLFVLFKLLLWFSVVVFLWWWWLMQRPDIYLQLCFFPTGELMCHQVLLGNTLSFSRR